MNLRDAYWPRKDSICKLDTGGSHLLKHFVWLLEVVDPASPAKAECNQLICNLAALDWKPKQPAAKVIGAAAHYLIELPKETAWEPLQAFCSMASSREENIRQLVAKYAAENEIDFEPKDKSTGRA